MSLPLKVLLVFDGTDEAQAALTRCSDLSLALSAQVDVVSVVETVVSNAACAGQLSELGHTCLEELTRHALETAVSRLKSQGVNARGYVAFGRTVDAISRHAETSDPDIVIVGHRARNKITRWWHDYPVHADLAERLFGSTIVTVTLPSA